MQCLTDSDGCLVLKYSSVALIGASVIMPCKYLPVHACMSFESLHLISDISLVALTSENDSAPTHPSTAAVQSTSDKLNMVAIIGGAVAVVFIIATTVIIVALVLRNCRAEFELQK